MIMEYVSRGKLQEFLRKGRAEHYYGNLHGSSQKLTSRDLTSFCYQVRSEVIIRDDDFYTKFSVLGGPRNGVSLIKKGDSP